MEKILHFFNILSVIKCITLINTIAYNCWHIFCTIIHKVAPPMKILIIDDEKFLIDNLSRYLSKSISSEIKCVDSADKALDLVRREKFDLIICDLNISDQTDGELIRKINETVPAQKFIVISAWEIPDHLKEDRDLNIAAYFEKPFNISDFERVIKKMEDGKFSIREL